MSFGSRNLRAGVSLVEALVALAVVALLFVAMVQLLGQMQRTWKNHAAPSWINAEEALNLVTQRLASATLEPYVDYADEQDHFSGTDQTGFVPDHLAVRFAWPFLCGPTSHLIQDTPTAGSAVYFYGRQGYSLQNARQGLRHLLNAEAFFIDYADENHAPDFALVKTPRWRFSLKYLCLPAEALPLNGNLTPGSNTSSARLLSKKSATLIAENIILLIVLPLPAVGEDRPVQAADYDYDSTNASTTETWNQLPPRLRVVLVTLDEPAAQMIAQNYGAKLPDFAPHDFLDATLLDSDLQHLDHELTTRHLGHRIYERTIQGPAASDANVSLPP